MCDSYMEPIDMPTFDQYLLIDQLYYYEMLENSYSTKGGGATKNATIRVLNCVCKIFVVYQKG